MRLYPTPAYRHRYLVSTVLGLSIAAVLYLGVFQPVVDWVGRHGEINKKEEDRVQLQKQIDEIEMLTVLNETLSTELENLGNELSNFSNTEVYVREMTTILGKHRIQPVRVDPQVEQGYVRIALQMEGSFSDTIKAAHALEVHPMPTRIESMRCTMKKNLLESRITLLVWLLHEQE